MALILGVVASSAGSTGGEFILGVTKPDATNTGLVSPTTTTVANDITYNVNGTIVQNTLHNGNVSVTGKNIYFYNCEFRGRTSPSYVQNIVQATNANQDGVIFERCLFNNRFWPTTDADVGANGSLQAHHATIIRCEMRYAQDGLGIVTPGNVTIQGSYIHDQWFYSPSSGHNDGTHSDGIQMHGGVISNVVIEGCNIIGTCLDTLSNCQIAIPPTYGTFNGNPNWLIAGNGWYTTYSSKWVGIYPYPIWGTSAILAGGTQLHNVQIINNWLDGGGFATINLNNQITDTSSTSIVITGNRIGTLTRDKNASNRSYTLICKSASGSPPLNTQLTFSGNTYSADGASANVRRNG